MVPQIVDFILAPDSASALRARNHLAAKNPGCYCMAGSWPELMAQARSAYLLPEKTDDWPERLARSVHEQENAFWAESLAVAPRETVAEIEAALFRLITATGPEVDWQACMDNIPTPSTRLFRRLSDLKRLLDAIGTLPGALQPMADLLASTEQPIRPIRVYWDQASYGFNAMQRAVLKKLGAHAPAPEARFQTLLEQSLSPSRTTNATLTAIRHLYDRESKSPRQIKDFQIIAVRDMLQEAEITAGLVQSLLAQGVQAANIGVVLPDAPLHLMAVEDVFTRCGLPLSGFNRPANLRDLGRETLRHFLLCLRKPAPVMAMAALITSPLFPWSRKEALSMAQAIMGGDVLLKSAQIPRTARTVMDLLEAGPATPSDLRDRISKLMPLLSDAGDAVNHLQRARETGSQLLVALSAMDTIDWDDLLYQAHPETLYAISQSGYWRQGIRVFHEGCWPWDTVEHLFVLGFNDGHFPSNVGPSAIFTDTEWQQIADAGWPMETNERIRQKHRQVFAAQLASASTRGAYWFPISMPVANGWRPPRVLFFWHAASAATRTI